MKLEKQDTQTVPKFKVRIMLDRGVRCGFITKNRGQQYSLGYRDETDGVKRKRKMKSKIAKSKKLKKAIKNAKMVKKADSPWQVESLSEASDDSMPEASDESMSESSEWDSPELSTNVRNEFEKFKAGFRKRRADNAKKNRTKHVVARADDRTRPGQPITTVVSAPIRSIRRIKRYNPRTIDYNTKDPHK